MNLETGFTVCSRFLEYWKEIGGLTQQGFPISDLFKEQDSATPTSDGKNPPGAIFATHKI
jgi:hypothetical protein